MSAIKLTIVPGDVTDKTLAQAPVRLLTFLTAVGTKRAISMPLMLRGWSDERMKEGYELLGELRMTSKTVRVPVAGTSAVSGDIATCEAFQDDDLPCARAFLEATHPEQADFLFHDYEAGKGAAAVLNVVVFLERLEALAKSPERKATRKADHEALALITLSGTTKEKLKKLELCAARVQSTSAPAGATPEQVEEDRLTDERRLLVMRKIHAFITLWAQVARKAVKRRDHQILLGIAKRHSPRKNTPVAAPAQPAAPAAPAAPGVPATPATPASPRIAGIASLEEVSPPSRAA